MRCRADTGGIPSLHSLHLSSLSALLVSSLFGVSALLGGWSSFSLRALFSRLQELTDKLSVMLEEHSCLFESHSPSHVNTDPAGIHISHNPQMNSSFFTVSSIVSFWWRAACRHKSSMNNLFLFSHDSAVLLCGTTNLKSEHDSVRDVLLCYKCYCATVGLRK